MIEKNLRFFKPNDTITNSVQFSLFLPSNAMQSLSKEAAKRHSGHRVICHLTKIKICDSVVLTGALLKITTSQSVRKPHLLRIKKERRDAKDFIYVHKSGGVRPSSSTERGRGCIVQNGSTEKFLFIVLPPLYPIPNYT